jgi:hypothetical protein
MKKIFTIVVALMLFGFGSMAQTTIYSETFEGSWTVPSTLAPAWSGTTATSTQWHRNDYVTGWSYSTSGGYTPAGAASTSYSARFHSYGINSSQTSDLISPVINLSAYSTGTNYLEFYHINLTGSDNLKVYVSTDGGTTWSTSLLTCNPETTWTMHTVTLATSSANFMVKFTATSDYGDDDIGIDQVRVYNYTPVTPYLSTNPSTMPFGYYASGTTSTEQSFTLSGGNLTGAPGNITVTAPAGYEISLTSGSGFSNSLNVPYATSTLASTTVYVRFAPTGAPADFNGNIVASGGGATSGVAVTGTSILTWCASTSTGSSYYFTDFTTTGGITNISNTGTAYSTNGYGDYTAMSASQNTGATVNFSVNINGISGGLGVAVWVDWNNNGSFDDAGDKVFTTTSYQSSNPVTGSFIVPATATAGTKRMRVRTDFNSSAPSACGNITSGETEDYSFITIIPSCPVPINLTATNITTSGADIGWTETGSATSWQYEIGLTGFTPGTGTKVVTTNNPVTLLTLSASSNYSVRVRSICTPGDTSSWTVFSNFSTLCGITPIPYFEGFNAVTVPSLPNCYSRDNVNLDSYTWETNSTAGVGGTPAMRIRYNGSMAMDDWFFTPKFNLDANKLYNISFIYSNDGGTTYPEKLEVKMGADQTVADMTSTAIFDNNNITGSNLVASENFQPSASGVYCFGFHGYSDTDMDVLVVDNISITEVTVPDLVISQNDVELCDTLGWFNPIAIVKNIGTDTVNAGDTIHISYTVNGSLPVDQKFTFASYVLPGDSTMMLFSTPVHFNTFSTYNCEYILTYVKEFNTSNNTTTFNVTFNGRPVVNLGHDTTLCSDATIDLSAGNPGATYEWWNGSTTSTYTLDSTFVGGVGTANFWLEVTDTHGCVSRDTIAITWSICSGIAEKDNIHMTIMPNPNNGIFTVNFGGLKGATSIQILDINGKAAISENRILTGTEKISYDLTGFANGIYTIRITNDKNVAVQKIIVN